MIDEHISIEALEHSGGVVAAESGAKKVGRWLARFAEGLFDEERIGLAIGDGIAEVHDSLVGARRGGGLLLAMDGGCNEREADR